MALIRTDPLTGTAAATVTTYTNTATQTGATFKYGGTTAGTLALMTGPTATYVTANWTATTADGVDTDLYVDLQFPANIEEYLSVVVRSPASNTTYNPQGIYCQLQPQNGGYEVSVADSSGTRTYLGFGGVVTPQPNVKYTLRIRAVGTALTTKMWATAGAEPAAWDVTTTQTVATTGTYQAFSIISGGSGAANVSYSNVRVYDAAGIPAVSNLPAGAAFALAMPPVPFPKASTAMPTGNIVSNGHNWVPIASQDFLTNVSLGNMTSTYPSMGYYNGLKDTSQQGTYDPNGIITVANSIMSVNMHTGVPSSSAQSGGAGTAAVPLVACVMPDNYTSVVYGRASVRFRANRTAVGTGNQIGYKLVFFWFPTDNNWNEGEIDAIESDITAVGRSRLKNATPGSGKGADGTTPADGAGNVYSMSFAPVADLYVPTTMTDWHVATAEWNREGIFIYWDGQLVTLLTNEIGKVVPNSPMNFKLQMETAIQEGTIDPTVASTVDIDWVVTYKLQDPGFGASGFGISGFGN